MSANPCVLDASALLALLNLEEGADVVADRAEHACLSSVNWSEVFGRLRGAGVDGDELRVYMAETGIAVIPFEQGDAEMAGELWPETRGAGLSLADRACLALAGRLAVPAITADRTWLALDLGIEIVCIR